MWDGQFTLVNGRVWKSLPEDLQEVLSRNFNAAVMKEREDLVKEMALVARMVARLRELLLGMAVDVVGRRMHRLFVERRTLDVEDARLILINPDRLVSHERSALHGECRA